MRKSAKGQQCTFQIPLVCNYDPDTVVLCHLPDDSGTGKMGGKSDDWIAAFGCSDCHDVIDGRVGEMLGAEKEFYMRRAMIRTWRVWIKMGIIKL